MSGAAALADGLRRQAEWRRRVARDRLDSWSIDAALALEVAAAHAEVLPEDHPALVAMTEAGWFPSNDQFRPSRDASAHLRRWGRTFFGSPEDLLSDLRCFAAGSKTIDRIAPTTH